MCLDTGVFVVRVARIAISGRKTSRMDFTRKARQGFLVIPPLEMFHDQWISLRFICSAVFAFA
jgi:hypothetical protein